MNPRRRWLAAGAAWPALAWTGALHAQAKPPVVIGWLSTGTQEAGERGRATFNDSMAALGWKLGAQYVFEARAAEGRIDRLPALAQEIAARKPALIVAMPSSSARAAMAAAPTTPVVLALGDPLATGLVTSLARPDGMITGLSNVSTDTGQKAIELLVEALPKLQRVGFLADSTSSAHGANVTHARRAAERFRLEAVIVDMAQPEDIEPAVARLAKAKVQALVVSPSSWFQAHMPTIMQAALAQRWPVVGNLDRIPNQGGLFSFSADERALIQRSATYVDRILKGAKPSELPIEQPTTFKMVLNLKTAKALGIVIPPSMRLRATEVIE
jgi:putative tryptophan/tyrosine transport system substrate-binding protein